MKTIAQICIVMVLCAQAAVAQTATNKATIRDLYENILNHRQLALADSIVAADYTNQQGLKGVQAFKQNLAGLLAAFPDGKWKVTAIIAEGNTVIVKQQMNGTHTGKFQQIQPTNQAVVVDGIAIYTFRDGRIIHSEVLTDRLGFMQQLGVIDRDLSAAIDKVNKGHEQGQ
ncbi:SnoaL-like polyketide cyclase [Chitinophaga jiangningensis]|uniref:SnoaL-like polyketide cyclase n=1 Tax=Chitinophaga jiangningensis TaxID=1419482 RepID=A0A1M7ITI0_9BACT|nr:ester cyclase [Chitinophaga jiangningensis]SHM44086.1 SnoaL-like polyketide cyclase [Chitinophaga jiangningensis]